MNHQHSQSGFTLLELLISLTMFSLLMTMGYQSLTTLALNQRNIERHSELQSNKGLSHLALRNALNSGAVLTGAPNAFELKLNSVDTLYFPSSTSISFAIKEGSLLSKTNNDARPTELMSDLEEASFSYLDTGQRYARWSQPKPPQMLEFSWLKNGQTHKWLFRSQ